jgi:hypothetical protein
VNRETFIAKLTEVQQTVEQLLAQLQASEHDKFAAHLYRSRREYRSACDRPERVARQSSGASSRPSRLSGAWASKGSCGSGRICCGLEIDRDSIAQGRNRITQTILAVFADVQATNEKKPIEMFALSVALSLRSTQSLKPQSVSLPQWPE